MNSEPTQFVNLCAQLCKDPVFASLESHEKRIAHIFQTIKSLQEFREDITHKVDNYVKLCDKSETKSQMYRTEGDNHMSAKNYYIAIQCYTNALLWAPFPTEGSDCKDLQKAYTARAHAFCRIDDYSNALFDAEMSMFLGSSVDMTCVKGISLKSLGRYGEAMQCIDGILACKEQFKLNEKPQLLKTLKEMHTSLTKELVVYGPNWPLPEQEHISDFDLWMEQKIALKANKEKGRHFLAKEKIPKGAVVISEKPQNAVISAQHLRSVCSCCQKMIGFQFWPCVWCNEVVFCDRTCHDRGIKDSHQFECKMTGLVIQSPLYQTFRVVTRIGAEYAFKTATDFDLQKFDLQKWLCRFYGRDCHLMYRRIRDEKRHHFEAFLSLTDNDNKYTTEDNAKHTLMAIDLALLIEYKKAFVADNEQTFVSFVAFLVKTFRRTLTNSFGWTVKDPQQSQQNLALGSCVSNYSSYINHSCDPTMFWQFFGDKLIFRAIRDVEPGEEMSISYGPNQWMPLEKRQLILRNNYHFSCGCNLCLKQVKGYPALKCLECEGPVLYVANIHRQDRDLCLQCGTLYPNIRQVLQKVAFVRLEFEESLKIINRLQQNDGKEEAKDEEEKEEEEEYEDNTYDNSVENSNNEDVIDEHKEEESNEKTDTESNSISELESEQQEQEVNKDSKENDETKDPEEKEAERQTMIDLHLKRAEEAVQTIIDLHYNEVSELIGLQVRLTKQFIICGKYTEAGKHVDRFLNAIDWSKCGQSCQHWEDLLFVTNAYYEYLKDQTVGQKQEWKQCFQSFSALKQSYKSIKQEDQGFRCITIDGKPVQSADEVKQVMREKKSNFSALKEVYKNLFTH
ncbi:uncharacterized protein LOC128964290 [Oppia nitens]|uniref:uncharacterized protein LOC128964290 n=1 Tax=Oppia nitens TaxID=1686743 RepID=UPI0023DBA1BF|nr:uncharacterized protein LOC128964290 [Oppia nitens]